MTNTHLRKPFKQLHIPIFTSTLFLLSMATLSFLFLFLCLSISHSHSSLNLHIQQACKSTRFPHQCQISLSSHSHNLPSNPNPLHIIHSAISLSSLNLNIAQSLLNSILDASAGNQTRVNVAKSCLQAFQYSHHRTSLTIDALSRGRIKDARAFMTAALSYQYNCWSGLKYANDTSLVFKTMSFLESLTGLSSNALSMILSYDLFGNDTDSWRPPRTERDGFWEDSGSGVFGPGPSVPGNLTPDVKVCKDVGNGCYGTIQEAVDAAPDNVDVGGGRRFVIHIKKGVYEETVRIPLRKRNVVFLGDGIGKTVITGSASVGLQKGMTTYDSATVGVVGDGFMAKDLTFENTAGANAHQAVAFRSDSDLSVIENCEFIGNQDTLYAHSLRQFYKSCRIIGNVDFIFGNSASFFQDCEILVQPRQARPKKGENNAITAHGRTDPAQSTGFVFHNCMINGTEKYMELYYDKPKVHKNYLGRPWKEYSRTVFINSFMEALITPQGWMPWTGDFGLNTLYYGEINNSGPGSNLTKRVSWSSQVPAEHVYTYSVQGFIQGDDWDSRISY
ncbi:probable pectinesterase/pectinesterase inhibitor 51 [Vicia villosa]|uniref:probable pectinesterase/pectinesterase inhibitor 51 n=1 Tax=Vicia villosa TaxID=3911 RepID=UPI00273C4557|nr:probable pectinesterase/pectinesterase inhibitor 51 [Vicia villosa]